MKKKLFKNSFHGKIPESSGVYFFLDKKIDIQEKDNLRQQIKTNLENVKLESIKKNILYIGKATNLKDRINSYFNPNLINERGIKITQMIENTKDLFFLETKNVLEAIILESKYIKEYKPLFNTREKDDKSYSYIVFTKEKYPKVLIMREREILELEKKIKNKDVNENINNKKKNILIWKKFGPFVSKSELIEILKILRKIFPFRDKCELNQKRACFNFQIKLCPGVCINLISEKDYNDNLKQLEKILSGNINKFYKDLETKMKDFAKNKNFEKAIEYREKIYNIKYINDMNFIKNKDIENNQTFFNQNTSIQKALFRIESIDVSHISGKNRVGVLCVLENGEIKTNEYKKFKLAENVRHIYTFYSK